MLISAQYWIRPSAAKDDLNPFWKIDGTDLQGMRAMAKAGCRMYRSCGPP